MADMAGATDRDAVLAARVAGCTPVVTRGFLRGCADCVKLVTCDGTLIGFSEAGWTIASGRLGDEKAAALLNGPVWELWGPGTQPEIRAALTRARLGDPTTVRLDAVDEDAQRAVARELEFTAVRDAEGRAVYILVVSRLLG